MTVNYALDDGYGAGARLGLIVLSTDETLENEARQVLAGRPVSLLHSRIPAQAEVTPDALGTMEGHIESTAALLPEGLSAVGFGCTSGATVIGPERVAALIGAKQGDAAVTNPMSAVLAALGALGARRIALLTPYVDSVNEPLVAALKAGGVEVVKRASFEESNDWSVARIREADTLAAMKQLGAGGIAMPFLPVAPTCGVFPFWKKRRR
ncbi:Asp/Glu racemase [Rhodobacteraceae bacterium D3-12]|nr:Asp/Glu racemase [Rhodobacteraceae bacterium D3-12]